MSFGLLTQGTVRNPEHQAGPTAHALRCHAPEAAVARLPRQARIYGRPRAGLF